MIDFIRSLGRWGLSVFEGLGRSSLFLFSMLTAIPSLFFRFSLSSNNFIH